MTFAGSGMYLLKGEAMSSLYEKVNQLLIGELCAELERKVSLKSVECDKSST